VTQLSQLCEEIRNAVDDQGAKECYRSAVVAYAKKTGLPEQGLWVVIDSVLEGGRPDKTLKRLHKSWGGDPGDWAEWYAIAQKRPSC